MPRLETSIHREISTKGERVLRVEMFGRWKKKREEHPANEQDRDPDALDREADPREGAQDPDYLTADPRELVGAERVTMAGPAGAPQEGKSVEERRDESGAWRERRADEP
jgi:hypothetical protein